MKTKTAHALASIFDETKTKFPGCSDMDLLTHTASRACVILGGQFDCAHVAHALAVREGERNAPQKAA